MEPYQLCIINPTRMKKAGVIPGVIVDEAKQFSRRANVRISIVIFHELAKKRIFYKSMENGRISLFTVPIATSRGLFKFITSYPRSIVHTVAVCRSILKKNGSALIRSDDTILTGIPGRILSFLSRKPRVVLVAGSNKQIAALKMSSIGAPTLLKRLASILMAIIEKIVISRATLLVISRDLARYYWSLGGRDIVLTPTYLDVESFHPRRGVSEKQGKTFNIVFVGRLEPEKGIMALIQAFAGLTNRYRNLHLTVVGDGTLREAVRESIRKERLGKSVSLLGTLDHQELPAVYRTADIFVLPSLTEGLPVSMLEAMASKLPVIVSSVGLVPKVLKNKENGILIKPGDVGAIFSAISSLIEDERLRIRIAESGYRYVKEFFGSYIDVHVRTYFRILN